ncbi:M48 family metalloprotease [Stieleria sp. JC731]|uniref:M48 family metalloprotease n=1 Tax=Pirellulaceae TaxID=2691357 RepID=UPI001E52CD02|nr:M48 family metalloprotease [Stieleria sp. JC731]MCC9602102.1 M48 family metalloprotease [Stieleria sp. JC731]
MSNETEPSGGRQNLSPKRAAQETIDGFRYRRNRHGGVLKLVLACLVFLFGITAYLFSVETNPITGERQRVAFTTDEEIELGLQSRGMIASEMGGVLSDELPIARKVDQVGNQLVQELEGWLARKDVENPFVFEFHVLADQNTVNALALPGGQIFITRGLLAELTRDDQLAAVLSHEIGHVVHRHASQRMAKAQLKMRSAMALQTATEGSESASVALLLSELLELRYGRKQELESDAYAISLMSDAGYDTEGMIELLNILENAGGSGVPEFLNTHPHPESRREQIREMIELERVNAA